MAIHTGPVPTGSHVGSDLVDSHELWNYRVRGETPAQRLDRCYTELLQEVRVAQTGVQVLLAFLLWVAFNPSFNNVTTFQRHLYVLALVLAALALALLIAPACANHVTSRRGPTSVTLRLANRCATGGLALLFTSLNCVLVLILDVVLGSVLAAGFGFATVMWFAVWWYILPLTVRHRHSRQATSLAAPPRPLEGVAPPDVDGIRIDTDVSSRSPLVCRWQAHDGVVTAHWRPTPSTRRAATHDTQGDLR